MRKRTIIPTLVASVLGLVALTTPSAAIHGGGHVGMGAPMVHAAPMGPIGHPHLYTGAPHLYMARPHLHTGAPHLYMAHPGYGHIHHFHHRRGVFIAGYPYYYDYDYDYGYYGGCGWLYQRAVSTGSAYWWERYRECAGY
jgi:hypothetical protein